MIDLHFHCLPGIDDGPRDWDEAVALCRAAQAEGTHTIIATPHVLRDPWLNEDVQQRTALIDELNLRLGGKPNVLAGCEYYISSDAVQLWEAGHGGPLVGLAESQFLLMEFPITRLPADAEPILYELSLLGVTPVIAHPERNHVLASAPDMLERFVDLGALVQVTAGSCIGDHGRLAQNAVEEFFRRRIVHLVASDAHSVSRRPPRLAAARERIRSTWGEEAETLLFDIVPASVVAGRSVEDSLR